jgi:hypothetical protein
MDYVTLFKVRQVFGSPGVAGAAPLITPTPLLQFDNEVFLSTTVAGVVVVGGEGDPYARDATGMLVDDFGTGDPAPRPAMMPLSAAADDEHDGTTDSSNHRHLFIGGMFTVLVVAAVGVYRSK